MINKKIITIDCDGVLMKKFLGRSWMKNIRKKPKSEISRTMQELDVWWTHVSQKFFRGMMEGADENLEKLMEKNYKLILLTSRGEHVKKATEIWLKDKGIRDCFQELIFNKERITPRFFKEKMVGKYEPVSHIDDDPDTIRLLAKTFPKKRFVYFNYYKNPPVEAKNVCEVGSWEEVVKVL